jgi:hypothetical protein
MSTQNGHRETKMNIWAEIWTDQEPNGKVHKSVVRQILDKLDLSVRFETIYLKVELLGVEDDLDKLATARAIRDMRDIRRASGGWDRKAICA